jgi:regulatory protein
MRTRSRQKSPSEPLTGEQLYESAVRALGRQARSSGEVRMLLQKRKATKAQIEEILHRLRENGYLDDARFARYYAAWRVENALHGRARVRRDLAARRLRPEIADAAVSKAFEEVDERELLRQYIRRKVRVSKSLTKPSTVQSLYRRLLHAGFSSATIIPELKRMLASPLLKGANSGDVSKPGADAEPPSWDELLDSLSEVPDSETDTEA